MKKPASVVIISALCLIGCATKNKDTITLPNEENDIIASHEDKHIANKNSIIDEKTLSSITSPNPNDTNTQSTFNWDTSKINFNSEIERSIFQEEDFNAEYYSKYIKYFPTELNDYESLLKNKIEQDLIFNIWLSNDKSLIDYNGFSEPIFNNLNLYFKKHINKDFSNKISKYSINKKNLLSKNYNTTLHDDKINLSQLFRFPIEFEISILKEGFFQSIYPLYLHTEGSAKRFSGYIDNKFIIADNQNNPIPLPELEKMNIPQISFSVKKCLKISNINDDELLNKLDFSYKLFSSFNYYKMNELLKTKYSKVNYENLLTDEEEYNKAINTEFISYYHDGIYSHKFNEPIPCSELFDKYSFLASNVKLLSK